MLLLGKLKNLTDPKSKKGHGNENGWKSIFIKQERESHKQQHSERREVEQNTEKCIKEWQILVVKGSY